MQKKSRRAGRPAKPDAKRNATTREGRGQGPDLGPLEHQAKRIAAAGDPRGENAMQALAVGDRRKAESEIRQAKSDGVTLSYPINILRARGLITGDEHEEGRRFAETAWVLFGAPLSVAGNYARVAGDPSGDEPPDSWFKRKELEHAERVAILTTIPGALAAVRSICQHLERPRILWMRIAGQEEITVLKAGLARLAATADYRAERVGAVIR